MEEVKIVEDYHPKTMATKYYLYLVLNKKNEALLAVYGLFGRRR